MREFCTVHSTCERVLLFLLESLTKKVRVTKNPKKQNHCSLLNAQDFFKKNIGLDGFSVSMFFSNSRKFCSFSSMDTCIYRKRKTEKERITTEIIRKNDEKEKITTKAVK